MSEFPCNGKWISLDLQIVSVNIVSDGTYITDLDPSLDTGILLMEVPQKEVVMDFK